MLLVPVSDQNTQTPADSPPPPVLSHTTPSTVQPQRPWYNLVFRDLDPVILQFSADLPLSTSTYLFSPSTLFMVGTALRPPVAVDRVRLSSSHSLQRVVSAT